MTEHPVIDERTYRIILEYTGGHDPRIARERLKVKFGA